MRAVVSALLRSIGVLVVATGPVVASECPPSPCDIERGEKSICEAKADWILELNANGIIDEFGRKCGFGQACNRVDWSGGAVTFSARDATIVRMTPDTVLAEAIQSAPPFSLRINAASWCWEANTRLPHSLSGKRVRFYGSNKRGQLIAPGYFAFEVVN